MKLHVTSISKTNLSLLGAIASRGIGFASTVMILYFFGTENYSQYVSIMALFSVIVIPLSEVLGHSTVENYPKIPSSYKNFIGLCSIILIIYFSFEYEVKDEHDFST